VNKEKIRRNEGKDNVHTLAIDDDPIIYDEEGNAAEDVKAVRKQRTDLAVVGMFTKSMTGQMSDTKWTVYAPPTSFWTWRLLSLLNRR